jgi:hypothetical protein
MPKRDGAATAASVSSEPGRDSDSVTDTELVTSDAKQSSTADVKCELLYFIQNRCHSVNVDKLIEICSNFYSDVEIELARSLIVKLSTKRLSKHTTSDKCKRTLADIIRVVLDPSVHLPRFYSLDMARIPAIGIEHVDVSALLSEVTALREEVKSMAVARFEIEEIRNAVKALSTKTTTTFRNEQSRAITADAVQSSAAGANAIVSSAVGDVGEHGVRKPSFALLAGDLNTGDFQQPRRTRKLMKIVTGQSTNMALKSVATFRKIDIFVSRLHPETDDETVADYVLNIAPDLDRESVTCTKLTSKFEDLYTSYFVAVKVPAADMKSQIDKFMDAGSWPRGLLVRRYFHPRNGN